MSLRLAHFTDVHVTAKPTLALWRYLFSKRILGWLNLTLLGRQRDFVDAPRILKALVRDLEETAPDHVVCTGDLTGLALPEEFTEARSALGPLPSWPHSTGIPGNHDVYVKSAVRQRLYEKSFGEWTRTDLAGEDVRSPDRSLEPYPLVRFLGQAAVLIAVNDVKPNALHDSSGRVGGRQMAALEHTLSQPEIIDCPVRILACHTSVFRADGSRDGRLHALRDGASLLQLASRRGVSLLLHGHTHKRFVFDRGVVAPVAIANPGSLTAARGKRAYHIYEIEGDRIRVSSRRYDATADCFEAWPEESGAELRIAE